MLAHTQYSSLSLLRKEGNRPALNVVEEATSPLDSPAHAYDPGADTGGRLAPVSNKEERVYPS